MAPKEGSLEAAYSDLGLKIGADSDQVKAAYRNLALKCHPDVNPSGSTEFMRIKAAYEKILNPDSPRVSYYGPTYPRAWTYTRAGKDPRTAVFWSLGIFMGCMTVGSILFWGHAQSELYKNYQYSKGGGFRTIEPTRDAQKRAKIAAILLAHNESNEVE